MDKLARVIAVDIGGTKIAAASITGSGEIGGTKIAAASITGSGEIGQRLVRQTPRTGGAEVLRVVAELITQLSGDPPALAVGVGAPGVIDVREGSVVSATDTLPGWAGTPVRAELERLTGLPVAVDNDVKVMARGELSLGAGRDADDVLFVSVGTGVGGALARDGYIVNGPHGTAGELAHLLVPARGSVPCGCGRLDHLESLACGPAIATAYGARTENTDASVPDVVLRMREGDDDARAAVTEAAELLGRTLAGLISAIDVDCLVIGGGVAQIGEEFIGPLAAAVRAEVLAPLRTMTIAAAELGTDAPLLGAGLLATDLLNTVSGASR